MRHLAATLVLLVAIAVAVGFASFRTSGDAGLKAALGRQDALEWLRADFKLTDAQFAQIKNLHDSYSVVCEGHCRDIQTAIRERNTLKATASNDSAEVVAADRRVEELRLVCETAITTHVRQCAALMSPKSRERYLALVLPKIKDFDHAAAPDVHLNHRGH